MWWGHEGGDTQDKKVDEVDAPDNGSSRSEKPRRALRAVGLKPRRVQAFPRKGIDLHDFGANVE
jgi:hypothetical protein